MKNNNLSVSKFYSTYRKTLNSFSFILLFLITFAFIVISCEGPNTIEKQEMIQQDVQKYTAKVEFKTISNIAYSFAKFLVDKENRKIIRDEISSSKKIENILEATELLNSVQKIKVDGKINDVTLIDVLKTYIPENEKANFRANISSLEFGQLDIYLPLEEWRKNWKSEDEVLVAAVDYRNNSDENDILAFNSKGDKIYLSAKETPQIPTIVVYPSEKRGAYYESVGDNYISEPTDRAISSLDKTTFTYDYRVYGLLTMTNWESWWGGWMEIFFKYRYAAKSSPTIWSDYYYTDLVYDVHRGVGKYPDLLLASSNVPLIFQIDMYEWDGWFTGADDHICNIYYTKVVGSDGNSTGYNTINIYYDNGTAFRTLWDGLSSSSTYDWIQLDID